MKIYRISWKHAQPGTYGCLHCMSKLYPLDVVENPNHHFNPGQLYKCSCQKSQVWGNSVRYVESLILYSEGKELESHSEDPEMYGFCNDEFCPFCWKPSMCLSNGYVEKHEDEDFFNKISQLKGSSGEENHISYDLFGCSDCDNKFLLTMEGKLGEYDGQKATAEWYKNNKELWINTFKGNQ